MTPRKVPLPRKTAEEKTTKCGTCGIAISYKTKRPTNCPKCSKSVKAYKQVTAYTGERTAFILLKSILEGYEFVMNGYYSWLRSAKNEPMQLDLYCPALKLAFEYQGPQHYEFNRRFHSSKADFEYRLDCDRMKGEICRARGIILLEIRSTDRLSETDLFALIRTKAPDAWKLLKRKP
jgi:hypothetical protein